MCTYIEYLNANHPLMLPTEPHDCRLYMINICQHQRGPELLIMCSLFDYHHWKSEMRNANFITSSFGRSINHFLAKHPCILKTHRLKWWKGDAEVLSVDKWFIIIILRSNYNYKLNYSTTNWIVKLGSFKYKFIWIRKNFQITPHPPTHSPKSI